MEFTVVTQVSEDRLWMLTQHCQRWPGRISAAVFTDLPASQVAKAIAQDSSVYGKCQEGQVILQTFGKTKFRANDYPVNALRNMALHGVQTSHFFYADIDFWTSEDLYDVLHTGFMKKQMALDPRMALVIPAFQMSLVCTVDLDCRTENIQQMPYHKEGLMDLVKEKKAGVFDPTIPGGHGSTSYDEWFRMEQGELWDIPCTVSNRYKPYIVARYRSDFPPYQEQFSGYGKNKMTHIMQLRHSGYLCSQVGGVFVVHYPHRPSPTRKAWSHGKKKHDELKEEEATGTQVDWTQFKRGQVDIFFKEFRRWLEADMQDQSRVPMCPDALNDDEKIWI
jgi:glycosyltransferase-like protein LARGE